MPGPVFNPKYASPGLIQNGLIVEGTGKGTAAGFVHYELGVNIKARRRTLTYIVAGEYKAEAAHHGQDQCAVIDARVRIFTLPCHQYAGAAFPGRYHRRPVARAHPVPVYLRAPLILAFVDEGTIPD